MRTKRRLSDDPLLHVCVLTFLSDLGAVMGLARRCPNSR